MASIKSAAEFIHANMPLGMGGSLTPQQAWDVATYMDSQVRPQDPRFVGDVAETRKKFHNSPFSMYGQTVNGAVLGDPGSTPPAGTVPTQATAAPEPEPDPPTEYESRGMFQTRTGKLTAVALIMAIARCMAGQLTRSVTRAAFCFSGWPLHGVKLVIEVAFRAAPPLHS